MVETFSRMSLLQNQWKSLKDYQVHVSSLPEKEHISIFSIQEEEVVFKDGSKLREKKKEISEESKNLLFSLRRQQVG